MNEQVERTLKILKINADKVAISLLGLMFVGLLGALLLEKSTDVVAAIEEPETLRLEDPLEKNPNWKVVQGMMTRQDITQFPAIRQIRQFNMFDFRGVRDRQEIERTANQRFEVARQAFSEGRREEARRILEEEVLRSFPAHGPAGELLARIRGDGAPAGEAPRQGGGGPPSPAPTSTEAGNR
jgi:hypothetical protein